MQLYTNDASSLQWSNHFDTIRSSCLFVESVPRSMLKTMNSYRGLMNALLTLKVWCVEFGSSSANPAMTSIDEQDTTMTDHQAVVQHDLPDCLNMYANLKYRHSIIKVLIV